MKDGKIEILDSLRAFAALSVCLFHFICTTTGYFSNETLLRVMTNGQYGVQLFFVISGFVIPWSMYQANFQFRDFFRFLLKRLARLEPPYMVSILLALAVLLARERFYGMENSHIQISGKQVALHFFYLIPFFEGYKWLNNVYWTLAIEFQYYIFMALIYIPMIRSKTLIRMALYAILIASSFFTGERFLFHWLPIFLLGVALFQYKAKLMSAAEFYGVLLTLLVVCVYHYPFMAVVYAAVPVAAILFYTEKRIPVLDFFGTFSYSIYLIHPLLGATFINVMSHRFSGSALQKIAVVSTGMVITLLSAWIMYKLVEKPSKRLSASIKY